MRKNRGPFPWTVHPIWRGIGFAFMVIVPIIGYGIVDMLLPLLEEPLPKELAAAMEFPGGIVVDAFWGRMLFTFFVSAILFLILMMLGSMLYSFLGGPEQEKKAKMQRSKRYRY